MSRQFTTQGCIFPLLTEIIEELNVTSGSQSSFSDEQEESIQCSVVLSELMPGTYRNMQIAFVITTIPLLLAVLYHFCSKLLNAFNENQVGSCFERFSRAFRKPEVFMFFNAVLFEICHLLFAIDPGYIGNLYGTAHFFIFGFLYIPTFNIFAIVALAFNKTMNESMTSESKGLSYLAVACSLALIVLWLVYSSLEYRLMDSRIAQMLSIFVVILFSFVVLCKGIIVSFRIYKAKENVKNSNAFHSLGSVMCRTLSLSLVTTTSVIVYLAAFQLAPLFVSFQQQEKSRISWQKLSDREYRDHAIVFHVFLFIGISSGLLARLPLRCRKQNQELP